MRIGILTLPLHTNYGGILQAYALQTMLERMGHEVYVFHREYISGTTIVAWKYPLVLGKRLAYKLFIDRRTPLLIERKRKKDNPLISQHTNRFIKNYIRTYEVDHLSDIPSETFDCIVVGSDQVWRPEYFERMWNADITDAFLKFTTAWHVRRIAYAASFGIDEWLLNSSKTSACRLLIDNFDGVSVREDSAVSLCSDYFGITTKHVLDPTMLLNANDYINLIKKAGIQKNVGTLYNYILDETEAKRQIVNKIASDRGMVPFRVNKNNQDRFASLKDRIIPPVEEWLRGFYDAEFVVTDSFHGCVFSIIFNKPFIAIGNEGRGLSRFYSLLKMFNMESHLVYSPRDYSSELTYDIPDDLKGLLTVYQNESIDFLKTSLSY